MRTIFKKQRLVEILYNSRKNKIVKLVMIKNKKLYKKKHSIILARVFLYIKIIRLWTAYSWKMS